MLTFHTPHHSPVTPSLLLTLIPIQASVGLQGVVSIATMPSAVGFLALPRVY